MLFATLAPLLTRLALKIDIQAISDNKITLTIVPRRREGISGSDDPVELRPISLSGSVDELDAVFAQGENGPLGQIVAARKSLSDQIAEQIAADKAAADEKQKAAANKAAKTKSAAPAAEKSSPTTASRDEPPQTPQIPEGDPQKPATLW